MIQMLQNDTLGPNWRWLGTIDKPVGEWCFGMIVHDRAWSCMIVHDRALFPRGKITEIGPKTWSCRIVHGRATFLWKQPSQLVWPITFDCHFGRLLQNNGNFHVFSSFAAICDQPSNLNGYQLKSQYLIILGVCIKFWACCKTIFPCVWLYFKFALMWVTSFILHVVL